MKVYQDLLKDVLANGVRKGDRTGTGTISVFGRQARFRLTNKQMPLCTTKKLHWKSIVHELLWMISGSTNIKYLQDNGVTIWEEWANSNGDLGPVYGKQWRAWDKIGWINVSGGSSTNVVIDQLGQVIEDLKTNPNSRRHIVSAWNVSDLEEMGLPPCHLMYQFYVTERKSLMSGSDRLLSCMMTIRSCDLFLGAPFNIASYALLTHMVAQVVGMEAHELIVNFGDLHLYTNHLGQAHEQLKRAPLNLPTVRLNSAVRDIDSFVFDDVELIGYEAHPHIAAKVSV